MVNRTYQPDNCFPSLSSTRANERLAALRDTNQDLRTLSLCIFPVLMETQEQPQKEAF